MSGGWTAIALSRDVPVGTTRAVILGGRELVVWRGEDGEAHVWEDRCPHRGMRLSFGFVRGNALNCLYHGWQYGASSSCMLIPAHPDLKVPPTIRANAQPVREASGLVWTGGTDDEAPVAPEGHMPLASVAVHAPQDVLARLPPLPGLFVTSHAVDGAKCMVHALIAAGTDANAGWATLVALRAAAEREMTA